MKSLTKEQIKKRFEENNNKIITEIKNIKSFKLGNLIFNKCLYITIPGKPMVDSRPRFKVLQDSSVHTFNPHKAQLMKIFEEIYNNSDILQSTCIIGPMIVEIDVYSVIPKVYLKEMISKEKESLKKGILMNISKPDLDNIEKIHYDVLQDAKFQILLRDEMIVSNNTKKCCVIDEKDTKVDIRIYYNEELPTYIKRLNIRNIDYLKYQLSIKYKNKHNISNHDWFKFFYKKIAEFYKITKKKDLDKTIRIILKNYKSEELDLLCRNKNDNSEKKRDYIINYMNTVLMNIKE